MLYEFNYVGRNAQNAERFKEKAGGRDHSKQEKVNERRKK